MVAFPGSPTVGQVFLTWQWDGTKWAPTTRASMPRCGRFGIVGGSPSNSLQFVPFNGNLIKINGIIYQIPSGGITAAANNCFINGVGGSSMTLGSVYFAYVFNNGGTLTLDFSTTTGHSRSTTAGNVGTEIKTGDDTRSFVGICYAGGSAPASNSFYDDLSARYVRSWFNRQSVGIYYSSSNTAVFGGQTFNIYFVALSGDTLHFVTHGSGYGVGAATIMGITSTINGANWITTNVNFGASVWGAGSASVVATVAPGSEGFNYCGQSANSGGVTCALYFTGTGIIS